MTGADLKCSACAAPLASPLGCAECGALAAPHREPTPFETFGLEPAYELDRAALRRTLLRLGRVLHPDYFVSKGADAQKLAERNTARLNEAYEVLGDDAARADWLVRSLGGPTENQQREMPKEFLMEVLEWNEALESAREAGPGSPQRAGLASLEQELRSQRDAALERVRATLVPLPEQGSPKLRDARAQLNALRYLDNTLAQIEELALPAAHE